MYSMDNIVNVDIEKGGSWGLDCGYHVDIEIVVGWLNGWLNGWLKG